MKVTTHVLWRHRSIDHVGFRCAEDPRIHSEVFDSEKLFKVEGISWNWGSKQVEFQGFYREIMGKPKDWSHRGHGPLKSIWNPPEIHHGQHDNLGRCRKGRKPLTMSGKRKVASWLSWPKKADAWLAESDHLCMVQLWEMAKIWRRFKFIHVISDKIWLYRYDKIWQDLRCTIYSLQRFESPVATIFSWMPLVL